jgi:multidrug efflux pump subunit AcrB
MWLVRIALERPYTFVVAAILILLLSPLVILRTPTDIFPNVDIPVIGLVFGYTGLNPEEMEGRITTVFERILTTVVNDVEHIESTTVNGEAVVKVFLQPNANVDRATAQITAAGQTVLRFLPPGSQPPLLANYNASTVPILQLGLSGSGLSEQQLNDIALNFLRTQLVTVPGAVIPFPFGGKQRQIMVDLKPGLLQSKGLSAADVVAAVSQQNLILPSGTAKIGASEYDFEINASPKTVPELNDLPLRLAGDSVVYLRDVANVRDGFAPQTNIVRQDGRRGALVTILKSGNASTIDVVKGVRTTLPHVASTLPPEL